MNRVIAVANQKGGVGKTTTAVNLAASLSELGFKVLAIDSDPQGNTSSGLGISKNQIEFTLYDLLVGDCYIDDATYKTETDNLFIIPSNINLSGAEIELLDIPNREYILKKHVSNLNFLYDFIIIDCPPSLSILTLNALTASNSVLIPVQCEYYALEGLSQLLHTVNLVKKKLNKNLAVEGIVFTMYDSRTNLAAQVVEEVRSNIKETIYESVIPRNVRLSEAPSHGMPINLYAPTSKGAISYLNLAKEIVKKGGVLK